MIDELRAEAAPELPWAEVERKLMIEVAKSDAARAAQRAAAPRSPFMQAFAFAAAAALIALGVSTANSGGAPAAAAPMAPIAVEIAQIQAAPGEPGARDLAQLAAGDVVVTSGTPVTFRREGVVAFTLAPSSRITVRSAGDSRGVGTTVELEQGAIHAEVVPRAASEGLVEAFAVEVARTRVAVHGTAFSVGRTESGIIVDVEHGTVAVGPTGNVGVTTGHILVGPSRASFSLDGGRTSRFLDREPVKAAPAIIAAAAPTAAAPPIGALAITDAPAAPGAHPAIAAHPAVAAIEAPAAPAPASDAPAAAAVVPVAPAALSEALISARLHQCFERANAGDPGGSSAFSVISTLHLTLEADGSVRSAIFTPPLKPELMACAGSVISGKFVDGNRKIDLPVSFHGR
jgi:FecR-like protein